MNRRSFLKSGSLIGTVGLVGCVDDGVSEEVIQIQWNQSSGPPGGPVTDIAVSEAEPEYLYATTETAGLYASSDGGAHWIQGPESEHHRKGIVASPHNPEIARTKTNRTVDGGRVWYTEHYRSDELRAPSLDSLQDIFEYAYDPFDEEILYAATTEGVYRTLDSGRTWERVDMDAQPSNVSISHLAAARDREGVVFAAFHHDATVVRSDDHGESWEVVAGAGDTPDAPVRGLVAEQSGDAAYVCIDDGGVYRVGEGPPQNIGPDVDSPHFLWYDRGPALSADDERLYYLAYSRDAIDEDGIWSDLKLYEYSSTTGETQVVEVPENPASVTAHPTNPSALYVGGWSWVWKSDDEGETWSELANGFVDRYLSAVGTNRSRPGTVIAGSICSTGLSVSHDHGESWSWKRSGLGPFHEGAFNEHYVMQIAASGDRVYVTTAAGLLISEDNGDTWRLLHNEFSGQGNRAKGGHETAKHLHGLAVDPTAPGTVYVGTGRGDAGSPEDFFDGSSFIWKSVDGGETWNQITDGFPSDRDTVVQDILVRSDDPEVIYVGTNAEDYLHGGRGSNAGTGIGVYRSTNGGRRWENLQTPFHNVHSLTQDAADPDVVFASSPKGVYRSSDGGVSWERTLSYNTKALLAHPEVGGVVFAGSRMNRGYWDLLVSEDGGETWAEGNFTIQVGTERDNREADGMDRNTYTGDEFGEIIDVAVEASDSRLIAATRGAGLWQGDISKLM